MFIFRKKKNGEKGNGSHTPVVERCSSEVPSRKSIESSLARVIALENILVGGSKKTKPNSKEIEKKYLRVLLSDNLPFSEKTNIFHMLLSHTKLHSNPKLLEIFFDWRYKYITKKKFLLLLLEIISNNIGFFENTEINEFVEMVCQNCEMSQKESYKLTSFYFISKITQLPVTLWTEKIMQTLCKCFQPKKTAEIVGHLLNSDTRFIQIMSLIKLISEKELRTNALVIAKDVIWGKMKVGKVKDLQFSVFLAILQVQLSETEKQIVDEMLKKTENDNLNENEVALIEEVKEYIMN